MRRRQVLGGAVVAIGAVTSLAGCGALRSTPGTIDVTVFNHATEPYVLELTVFSEPETDTRSASRVFDAAIEVPPGGEGTRRDVAEQARYLVRYEAYRNDSRLTDESHDHYIPSDGPETDTLTFDIDESGVVTRR